MPNPESSQPEVEAVEAEGECGEEQEEVTKVCGRRSQEQEGRIQGGNVANR